MSLPRLLAGPRKRLMARLLLNGMGQALVTFGTAWLLREGLAGIRSDEHQNTDVSVLIFLGLILAGCGLMGLRVLERVDAERLGMDYVMKTRLKLFEWIAAAPWRTDRRVRFGITMTRLVTDLNSLKNWVSLGVARSTVACVSIAGSVASLAYFSPRAAVVAAGVVALSLGLGFAITPRLRGLVREARRRRGRLAGDLGEKVFTAETVRHFGKTQAEIARLRRYSNRLTDAMVRRMRTSATLRALPDAAFPISVAAFVGIWLLSSGNAGPSDGELVISLLIFGMIIASLRDLALAWDYRLSFEEARRRLNAVLSYPRVLEASDALDLPGEGAVAISYAKVGVPGALGDVSCKAQPGERVLVTGPNGSGKSTLIALAARMFDPDQGEVRLDGHPLTGLSLSSIHGAVQLVSPDLTLLRGTVAHNIGYGLDSDEPDPLLVERAVALCGLEGSSELLPDGLESKIEEKGHNLPDGLRARIALARAIVASPRLLLIDDFAFLADHEAQKVLRRVLGKTGATVLMVGSEGQDCFDPDQVWRLESGNLEIRESLARAHPMNPPLKSLSCNE